MTKEEFLSEFRSALTGSVSSSLINENMNYYEDYINTELRKGRTEEDIFQELGNPRLLARTVIETAPDNDLRGAESSEREAIHREESEDQVFLMPWWMILLVIFGIMILIYLVIQVTVLLLPVVIAMVLALAVARLLKRKR